MKNLITLTVLCFVIALNVGCKKAKATVDSKGVPETPFVYPDYAMLKKGNYWIYGRFQVEQNGQVTDLKQTDSCYVEKDTVVRGNIYFKIHKFDFVYNMVRSTYCRDSLHYIVGLQQQITFSSEDFSTIFYTSASIANLPDTINPPDTTLKITRKMTDEDQVIHVPAGSFTTSNMQTSYLYYPKYVNANVTNPRNLNYCCAKNIGLILETEQFFFSVPYVTERRLLRYHIN